MSLPVSQYEALLAEMRGLRRKAQRVQQIARPLLQADSLPLSTYSLDSAVGLLEFQPNDEQFYNDGCSEPLDYTMESLLLGRHNASSTNYDHGVASSVEGDTTCSEDEYGGATRSSTKLSVSSEPTPETNRIGALYHGTWPVEKNMWNSEPTSLGAKGDNHTARKNICNQMEVNSVMSFASSSGGVPLDRVLGSPDRNKWSSQQLEAKMDVVHSLLSMLGGQEHVDMGETLLALSTCPESCLAMRQSGCIPLLVQLVQSDRDGDTRTKAAQALHNLVHSQPDEKLRKRESRVLKLLDHCRAYTEALKNNVDFQLIDSSSNSSEDGDKHPVQTVAHLMKLSFDEGHRQAICQLGGIHTIATLVEAEHTMHSSTSTESHCILMRRYACMALTNLTFGDSGNKALLCSFKEFMRSLVVQLQSASDELRQVTASVLRNLSWRADSTSKEILREVGSVTGLMKAATMDNKENTLKSILSALWNLSAHCTENKSEICSVNDALGFLVDLLTYKTPTKSLAIIENSGGILRNISSQIAVREDYRAILRQHNCLQILLEQLKSPSLTIVSNACGTLWNLSAKCQEDQEALWQMGAPAMLRCLNHSKHKMIAMGSSAALKNLLSAKPQQMFQQELDTTALTLNLPTLPTLGARKQKALMQDLDTSLSETYENIEKDSPVKKEPRRKSEIQDLSNNFASLNLNEPSTSYSSDPRLGPPRIPPTYGSSSLPYKRPNCTFIPVRNNFSDCGYDDEIDISDQPIDYSKKYSETKLPNPENVDTSAQKEREYAYNAKSSPPEKSFGIYAETDLDQPTDYSLRYAEDDSDSEIAKNEDTLKTYCTEDTPYETPFNFSTATSMSDLRIDDKQIIDNDKLKERESKNSKKISESPEEKERCSTEDISDLDHRNKLSEKIPKSELSSGLMSPEKPVNYAEEGTPGYFSRVSSFGSLTSIPANETIKGQKQENRNSETEIKQEEKISPKTPAEGKAVKFERVVNYAEETPLMFSRSSSLASLDSIEQHSIHDDRSSVVSDFSRLTSGIVSPSELPDSPTQTVPPSPKPRKTSLDFPSGSKVRSENRPQPASRTLLKPSVFEDNVTKFKEESTPIQFSTATSLSSLTIDDHEESSEQASGRKPEETIDELKTLETEEAEKKDEEKETTASDINDDFVVESDVDEDILADCISIGMQNNRHNQSKPVITSTPTKLPVSSFKYTPKTTPNSSIPMPRLNPRMIAHTNHSRLSEFDNNVNNPVNQVDTLRTYCTEDTPVRLSNAASNSDLSLLSASNEKDGSRKGDYLSDDSSNLSGENDNILAECIQSGMPKAKKDTKIPSNNKSSIISSLPRRSAPPSGTSPKYSPTQPAGNSRKCEAPKVPPADLNRRDNSLPVYLNAGRDEVENYAVENSPCQFSLRSSLSDLTVDGSVAALKRNGGGNPVEGPSNKSEATVSSHNQSTDRKSNQESRRESLSSISVESLGSLEAEQVLLAQCISSGMPKSNTENRSQPVDIPNSMSNQLSPPASHSYESSSPLLSDPNPKNVSAASVAGNTQEITTNYSNNEAHPAKQSNAVAGVEKNPEIRQENETKAAAEEQKEESDRLPEALEKIEIRTRSNLPDTSLDKCSLSEEISSPDAARSGSRDSLHKILDVMEDRLIRSCEDSKVVDNRMLDPDAMIESLDRFTAELMSQASHLNKDENYKASTSDNTWNEEISPNDVTFPSISGSAPNVITFSNEEIEDLKDEVIEEENYPSNDFSSVNTSTMTDSTLIAIEASKVATAFKKEADMSASITSAASLELDLVQPPSQMNSLTNSAVGLPRSPKLPRRKKSLPIGLMVRRALNHSLNNGSSLESLSNLDHVNPPSDLLYDMEGSMTSVASLPVDYKTDFIINGPINNHRSVQHPIFDLKQPFSELENINPPSLFNEITDFCNSLADIPTEAIGSETEIFEDCFTHVVDEDFTAADYTIAEDMPDGISDSIMETAADNEDDITIFSDAKSSIDSTPKKIKSLSKSMTTKQRRNRARDRFKTYTVAAEMVMREEIDKQREIAETSEGFKTADVDSGVADADSTTSSYLDSPTYSAEKEKLTPKERRQMNRSRFETQILDQALTDILQQPVITSSSISQVPQLSSNSNSCSSSPAESPARTKLSIRRNFMQKRLENKERFRTRTISESSFSPEVSSASPTLNGETEVQLHLQKEANRVLKTLQNTKTQDELLDCETLSLVSNDDDSEYNSGGSVNYRTYHKSWGLKKNVPVITPGKDNEEDVRQSKSSPVLEEDSDREKSDDGELKGKPKIIKPDERGFTEEIVVEEQPKGIRGRRKPLYSKTVTGTAPRSIKPVKTVTSNLVKNVTSSLKSGTVLKAVVGKPNKNVIAQTQSRASSGYGSRSVSNSISPKTSPARTPASCKSSPKHATKTTPTSIKGTPPLDRQGTFTKDEQSPSSTVSPTINKPTSKIPTVSKIPSFGSKIASKIAVPSTVSKIPGKPPINAVRNGFTKSASSDRAIKNPKVYNRSTSADSREPAARKIQASPSSQSLKGDGRVQQNGAVKKSSIPSLTQRSSSNNNLNLSGSSGNVKKQVTSKIASLWKRIEDSKKKVQKPDTRVWIQAETEREPRLIRSNTFDNKDGMGLKIRCDNDENRISRLDSFDAADDSGDGVTTDSF